MPHRIAYLPLETHPEAVADPAILAALSFAAALGARVHVSTFAVEIPPVASPLGGYLINVEGMARAAEERSRAECARLQALVSGAAGPELAVTVSSRTIGMGGANDAAATESRYFDLTVLPMADDAGGLQDMAQALIFGSGLPVILVPAGDRPDKVDHVAVAWDESRVAARALGDALHLLAPGGRITVLTVHDEKALKGPDLAQRLAASLRARGHDATGLDLSLGGRPIADVLQGAALDAGAQLLAMGGFGHSRLRDFILGGATKGALSHLRLPVLLSH